jgi:phosphoglycolate phosphatase
MSYDAIIYDNDGVLTKPTDRTVVRDAARAAFTSFDVSDPLDEHVKRMASGVTIERLQDVCGEYGIDPAAFWEERDTNSSRAQQDEIRNDNKPLYEDIEAVWALDQPRGIVSSNQHATIECILDHFDLTGKFETYYGRQPTIEHIRRKKPEPYFIECAMADLGTENALYVGDSPCDVEAAENAGIDSAFIRRPHRTDTQLSTEPTYDLDDLWELEQHVD